MRSMDAPQSPPLNSRTMIPRRQVGVVRHAFEWMRFIGGLLLAFLSCFVVFRGPFDPFQDIKYFVTENSIGPAIIAALLIGIPGWRQTKQGSIGALLALLAFIF